MHALHMAPRDFARTALLALLLALAMVIAGGELAGLELPSFSGSGSGGGDAASVTTQAPAADSGTPAWVSDPLRPPTFELAR
jgi:hypothetical protein